MGMTTDTIASYTTSQPETPDPWPIQREPYSDKWTPDHLDAPISPKYVSNTTSLSCASGPYLELDNAPYSPKAQLLTHHVVFDTSDPSTSTQASTQAQSDDNLVRRRATPTTEAAFSNDVCLGAFSPSRDSRRRSSASSHASLPPNPRAASGSSSSTIAQPPSPLHLRPGSAAGRTCSPLRPPSPSQLSRCAASPFMQPRSPACTRPASPLSAAFPAKGTLPAAPIARRPGTAITPRLSVPVGTSDHHCKSAPCTPSESPHPTRMSAQEITWGSPMWGELLGSGGTNSNPCSPLNPAKARAPCSPPVCGSGRLGKPENLDKPLMNRFGNVDRMAHSCQLAPHSLSGGLGPAASELEHSASVDVQGQHQGGKTTSAPARKGAGVASAIMVQYDTMARLYGCTPGVVPLAMQPLNTLISKEIAAASAMAEQQPLSSSFTAVPCFQGVQVEASSASVTASSNVNTFAVTRSAHSATSLGARPVGLTNHTDRLLSLMQRLAAEDTTH